MGRPPLSMSCTPSVNVQVGLPLFGFLLEDICQVLANITKGTSKSTYHHIITYHNERRLGYGTVNW